MTMSWFAGADAYNKRRKRSELRHAVASEAIAPEAGHPALGLGGRSIELSLAQGIPVDRGAFELAVDELQRHVVEHDWQEDELLESGIWLSGLPGSDGMSAQSLAILHKGLDLLRRP